ncbi:hypothetical protein M409DRAFT_55320 [Zasmidium cellare ATCC 36951]|uniref:Heterokaryon incompatibility domain-containing protein n=1 Tax=Zasmidium cellare ATCC 36951 TaxID=1080233 RepID=A0A6A6CJS6_ZASCE|nr:uncharacterized protein M409DRAFT_55320 [Zasmidium cellare ATCC 36951]KAF2165959.1 hypothetical protein M409DRAFT_55320 [Zasmidium cellare ATCC 36951]
MSIPYNYRALKNTEIRLFRVTASEDGTIIGQIEHFPLVTAPEYAAVSYRWGSTDHNRDILIDDGVLSVTSSLHDFLVEVTHRQTRNKTVSWPRGWFWIDAICIDQANLSERNEQVRQMKEIYEHASNLVIWLGVGEQETAATFDTLQQIACLDCDNVQYLYQDDSSDAFSLGCESCYVPLSRKILHYQIGHVFGSPYWKRAWIIQEASTPKPPANAIICSGPNTISWQSFFKAHRNLFEARPQEDLLGLMYEISVDAGTIPVVLDTNKRRFENGTHPLYDLLVNTRDSEATDSRDKVYSILALSNERHEAAIQPDYSQSVEEVYTRLAKTLIMTSRSMDALGLAGGARKYDVPSWVADWSVRYEWVPDPFPTFLAGEVWEDGARIRLFNADGDRPMEVEFEDNGRCLVARGFQCDTITNISSPRIRPRSHETTDHERDWRSWHHFAISNSASLETLTKLLTANISQRYRDMSADLGGHIPNFTHETSNVFALDHLQVNSVTYGRTLFLTENGRLGIGPMETEAGDVGCVLFGKQTPVIMRRKGDCWTFKGEAYIEGIMEGQAEEAGREEDKKFRIT